MIFNDFSDSEASTNLTGTASDSFESSLASSISEMNLDKFLPSNALITPDLIQLERYTWCYRGEGGANLVISLEDEKGRKQIARFSKSKYKDKDNNAKIDETAFYANCVMTPLLGSRFVRPVTIGIMDEFDFETVKMEAQPHRPLNRVKKDIKSRKVIVSPDCVFLDSQHLFNTFGSTLSIEVKPKCGFFNPGTSTLCPRCLKQEAKLNEGNIDCISKYCPLDLFSGDLARMKRAIFDLFESPHNRFKIFKDGELVYTEKIGHQEEVDGLLNDYFKGKEKLGKISSSFNLTNFLRKCNKNGFWIRHQSLSLNTDSSNAGRPKSQSKPLRNDA